MKPKVEFENIGYFIEYSSENGKYIGCITVPEKDRETIGYYGRTFHVATETIHLDNGKRIKKGTKFSSMLYPLCGNIIK